MSKRYGRNQRRKHREELAFAVSVSTMNAENALHLRELLNTSVLQGQQLKKGLRAAQNEIAEMVKVLRPVTEVSLGVRPIMHVSTQLTFTRPSPEAAYKMDMEKLMILSGPEAQAALAFEIGKDIAEFFSRYGK